MRVEAHERRPEIAHPVDEGLDEFRLTSLANVRGTEAANLPVAVPALRKKGTDAGYAVDGSLGELAAKEFLSLGVVAAVETMKATKGVEAGDGFEIEAADPHPASSPRHQEAQSLIIS